MDIEKAIAQTIKKDLAFRGIEISDEQARGLVSTLISQEVPISKKEMKKARQQFNRQARVTFGEYGKKLSSKLNEMNDILKPRPRWFPRFAWKWLAGVVIDISKLEHPLTGGQK